MSKRAYPKVKIVLICLTIISVFSGCKLNTTQSSNDIILPSLPTDKEIEEAISEIEKSGELDSYPYGPELRYVGRDEIIGGPHGIDLSIDIQPGDIIPAENPIEETEEELARRLHETIKTAIAELFPEVKLSDEEIDELIAAFLRIEDGEAIGNEDELFQNKLGVSIYEFFELLFEPSY